MKKKPNKSLHRIFDPLPIFASEKTGIASNAGELRRYVFNSSKNYFRHGDSGNGILIFTINMKKKYE